MDEEQSYRWLKFGDIKEETDGTILAAEDHVLSTEYFKNNVLKKNIDSKCWLCKPHEENFGRITSECPVLAKNEYLMKHDTVGVRYIIQYAKH